MTYNYEAGLRHYLKGNYFAARDIWVEAEARTTNLAQKCELQNAIGAGLAVLGENQRALEYFRAAHKSASLTEVSVAQKIKILSNLASTSGKLRQWEKQIEYSTEALNLDPTMQHARDVVSAQTSMLQGMTQLGLVQETLSFGPTVEGTLERFASEVSTEYLSSGYRNLGAACRDAGDLLPALEFYTKAYRLSPKSGDAIYVARTLFDLGQPTEAVRYLNEMYLIMWDSQDVLDTAMARTLEMVGLYARNVPSLAERFFDKAELLLGQLGRWKEWLQLQQSRTQISSLEFGLSDEPIDFEKWARLLDDLTLLDSVSLMFPKVYRVNRLAVSLAERIIKNLGLPLTPLDLRNFRVSGRLYFLGLTGMVATEVEAFRYLRSAENHDEALDMTIGVLSAYPHGTDYIQVLEHCKSMRQAREEHILADCMYVGLRYALAVEVTNLNHFNAVDWVLDNHSFVVPSVVEAFLKEVTIQE